MADAATDEGTIALCRRLGTRQFPIVLIMQKFQTSGTRNQQSRLRVGGSVKTQLS
jgi:hypothetical protein